MPFKSPAQARLMRARAHGWKPDRIKGPSVKVAKEFVAADKKAKGMQVGGLFSAKKLRKMMRKQDPDYDPYARYGTEPLTLKQASRRVSSKTKRGAEVLTAKREMTKAGWSESGGKWYPPQATLGAPRDPASGPLWNEYLVDLQAKGDPQLIGPRTMGASLGDPTQYAISTKPVASRGEPTPAMSQERRGSLLAAGYTPGTGRYSGYMMPPAELLGGAAPVEDVPPRTTQPIPGEGGLIAETPAAKAVTPASLRAEIPEHLRGMIAGAGRTPPSLLRYLERARAAAGEEPVEMQFGGALNFLTQGRVPPMQQAAGRGQPGRGAMDFLTRGRVPQRGVGRATGQGMQKFLRRGQVPGGGRPPQPGGGGLARAAVQPGPGGGVGSDMGMQKFLRRGQVPGGGSFREAMMNRGVMGPQPRSPGPGAPPMKGIGRAPGAGVPLRGVGRPPGMGRPGAGGGVRAAVMPGRSFMPGGGGAGMPGGANRIGMGDQQGALARATQVQTGRPPMSRRQGFPGRGGRGRFARNPRGRGRFR